VADAVSLESDSDTYLHGLSASGCLESSPYTACRSAALQTSWRTDSIRFSSRVLSPLFPTEQPARQPLARPYVLI